MGDVAPASGRSGDQPAPGKEMAVTNSAWSAPPPSPDRGCSVVAFAYLPGSRSFECFQVAIDPPLAGRIAVLARSIDTDDASEFEQRWEGTTDALPIMLGEATDTIRGWANRPPASGG